jgi:hypothetical protein
VGPPGGVPLEWSTTGVPGPRNGSPGRGQSRVSPGVFLWIESNCGLPGRCPLEAVPLRGFPGCFQLEGSPGGGVPWMRSPVWGPLVGDRLMGSLGGGSMVGSPGWAPGGWPLYDVA